MVNPLPLRPPVADPPNTPVGPAATPLAVDARGLAALLSGSLRWVRTQDAAGKLPAPRRVGGRVLWDLSEIRAWLAAGAPCRNEWEARQAAR